MDPKRIPATSRPTRMRLRAQKGRDALRRADRVQPVNLAIIGVQKAATSTIFRMLTEHPRIVGGPGKEMRFFMSNDQDWENPDYAEYARVAEDPSIRWAMDATPAYFYWPPALERMHRYDPDMRLLLSVRDPVERGFSQWAMERQRDPDFPDLAVAVRKFGRTELPDPSETEYDPRRVRRLSLFARGRYGAQLQRGLGHFPRDQWLILDFRALPEHPHGTMDRITDFLEVDRFGTYPELRHNMATSRDNTGPATTAADVADLVESFREDLALFAQLSGLDVSRWPTAQVIDGTLPVEAFTERLLGKLGLAPA